MEKNKYFLLIRLKKIIFMALDQNNKILFQKEQLTNENVFEKNFNILEKFLDHNVINLEKKLKYSIEDINLIIDINEFIILNLSTISNFNNSPNQIDFNSNYLFNVRDDVIKHMSDYDLIHMIINKYIFDGKDHFSLPSLGFSEKGFLEIKFILLKRDVIQNLRKIFFKFKIFVQNILSYDYVQNFKKPTADNIFDLADKLINGHNENEVLFIKNNQKKLGFFEKFFNFFN